MSTRHRVLFGLGLVVATIGLASSSASFAREPVRELVRQCRVDMGKLCSDVRPGGGRIAACLSEHQADLSQPCQDAIGAATARRDAGGRVTLPMGTELVPDIIYGQDEAQRFDVYRPANAHNAPVIVMMHGGGWAIGSKSSAGVVQNKIDHYLPKGFLFVSVETRLLPNADPLQQADDLAQALAMVQKKLPSLGGDPSRLVLMGHSAGAHLVALLTTNPDIAIKAGVTPWRATVALDSAAYDVADLMRNPNVPDLYRNAFGKEPAFWETASPVHYAGRPGSHLMASRVLLVCSPLRKTSCPQADGLASKLGDQAQVLRISLRHMPINSELGKKSEYTAGVDAFLVSAGMN